MNSESLLSQLKQKAEELVKRGGDVRTEIAHLVTDASTPFYAAKDGLGDLVKAVADGAVAGAREALPGQSESVLREVVSGVTDGLAKSAQAVKLTLEESTASGTRFANEDMVKIGQDFATLATIIVEIVSSAANSIGGHAKEQANVIGEHAQQSLQGIVNSLGGAFSKAQKAPSQLGRETVEAGSAAVKQAAGVLFDQIGQYLQKAGQKLRE